MAQNLSLNDGDVDGANQGGAGHGREAGRLFEREPAGEVVPAKVVHAVLDAHGCNSQRVRSFPAVAGVYYCMSLSLYPEAAYEEVFAAVAQGLAWATGAAEPARVAKSSISELRSKIGAAPLRDLAQRCCTASRWPWPRLSPKPSTAHCGWWPLDGSNFELPNETDNVDYFGRLAAAPAWPVTRKAPSARCWWSAPPTRSWVPTSAPTAPASEWEICQPLLSRLEPGMLCLADRGFNGYEYWRQARATGAQLLWRCSANRQLPVHQMLEDGSYLSAISGVDRGELARPVVK